MGFVGWGYEDVLPYFRRAEDNERGESYYHDAGGPLTVSDCRSMHPLVGACIEVAVQTGIAPTGDHNGPAQAGAGWFQFTQRNDATPVPCGTRSSPPAAWACTDGPGTATVPAIPAGTGAASSCSSAPARGR
jgi:hypothetical protein